MTEKESEGQPPSLNETLLQEETEHEYKDKYLRLLAELDNTRKRMQKEKQEATRFTVENTLSELLEPMDNLENALRMTENAGKEVKNWAQGFVMILGQFKEILHQHGITPFHSEGQRFNPEIHYAVEMEETTEKPDGTILQEYVKGYRSKDRTVRPARVKVAVAPRNSQTTEELGEQ